MGVTTSTNVASTIYAKIIETLVIAYQYDDVTAVPYFRYKSIMDMPSAAASFPRAVKSAGYASVGTETTSIAATTYSQTNVDISVSRIGLAREVTTTATEDSILGRALYTQELVADAARLFGEAIDTDATALFSGVTAIVGSTGVSMTIATMIALVGSQRANKARGPGVIHLHDLMLKQLQTAQAAATATPWATFYQPNADTTQFGGYFMGSPIWSSSKNPTANAAADRLGAMWVQGQAAPKFSAFALAVKRMPSSLEQTDILQDANIWASFARYGVGTVANNFATAVQSANS